MVTLGLGVSFKGRLGVVYRLGMLVSKLRSRLLRSLSIGCGETRLAELNLDINSEFNPDVVGDALRIPFRSEAFDLVYFTDVIEHLPRGREIEALREIFRILKHGGILILSTPHKVMLFTLLDPAFWLINHRHYDVCTIRKLLEKIGFIEIKSFTCGNIWTAISVLWYSLLIYPLKRILHINSISMPLFIRIRESIEYNKCFEDEKHGYTLFTIAVKVE